MMRPAKHNVDKLRKDVSQLFKKKYHGGQRVMGMWNTHSKPPDWPHDLIFADPQNAKGCKRPNKPELIKMHAFLTESDHHPHTVLELDPHMSVASHEFERITASPILSPPPTPQSSSAQVASCLDAYFGLEDEIIHTDTKQCATAKSPTSSTPETEHTENNILLSRSNHKWQPQWDEEKQEAAVVTMDTLDGVAPYYKGMLRDPGKDPMWSVAAPVIYQNVWSDKLRLPEPTTFRFTDV